MTTNPDPLPTPKKSLLTREGWWRLSAHAVTLALIGAAVWVAQASTAPEASLPAEPASPQTPPQPALAVPDRLPTTAATDPLPALAFATPAESASLTRLANPNTDIPDRPRYEITQYTVQRGDTVFGIAAKFNLKPETILWGNPEIADNLNLLKPGKVLNILPINGALRIVQPGDRLDKIASVFNSTVEKIVGFAGNDLDPNDPQIREGQALIIPDGWREVVTWSLPVVSRRTSGTAGTSGEPGACAGPFSGPSGTYTFVWPANNRYLSGWDYIPGAHPGLDIAAGMGAPIYASDTGVVVFSGWSTRGYGNLIIVDHGNGWQTAYAHLSQINVRCGQGVFQGNLIGLSGSTGNSTGAHLHFEMRHSEYGRVNPWQYLP